jgi:lipoyl-dependent peroxiredoxin
VSQIEKVLYTAKTHAVGARSGTARSDDGQLDVKFSPPGSPTPGTNPEQLFAAGWSACFMGAMGRAASKLNVKLPADLSVDAEIDLGTTKDEFFLQARLNIRAQGLPREVTQAVVEAAHQICPYSKATRGNIDVTLNVL